MLADNPLLATNVVRMALLPHTAHNSVSVTECNASRDL